MMPVASGRMVQEWGWCMGSVRQTEPSGLSLKSIDIAASSDGDHANAPSEDVTACP
jgi:hypothetical protein